MKEIPVDINQRRINNLRLTRDRFLISIAEIDMEIQRIQLGQKPKDIKPFTLAPRLPETVKLAKETTTKACTKETPCGYCGADRPTDLFQQRRLNYDQTRAEQADIQSDNPERSRFWGTRTRLDERKQLERERGIYSVDPQPDQGKG